MSKLTHIIIHCSDSSWGTAREIRKWHLRRGWKDIGYHFVVLNGLVLPNFRIEALNGSIECGREIDGDSFISDNEIGAHALGYNDKSIGICGIAKTEWREKQLESLATLVRELMSYFNIPLENVLGHCETESGKKEGKTCPNMDMNSFRERLKL